jgi:dUTPase
MNIRILNKSEHSIHRYTMAVYPEYEGEIGNIPVNLYYENFVIREQYMICRKVVAINNKVEFISVKSPIVDDQSNGGFKETGKVGL